MARERHEPDDAMLERLSAWGKGLKGFKREHARNALLIVRKYVEGVELPDGSRVQGVGVVDPDKLLLFAKDLTWTFWLDEAFDGRDRYPVDTTDVVNAIFGQQGKTAEAEGFVLLDESFREHLRNDASPELALWRATAAAAVTAWGLEHELSRGRTELSYAEYVENGVNSTAVPHIVATASLLYDYHMSSRLDEEAVRRLVRNLSLSCRLHNDLFSVEKERQEGCMANAVLLLDMLFPGIDSQAFVARDLGGYERMISKDVEKLGAEDVFSRLATVMPAAHQVLYTSPRTSYRPPT